MNDADEDGVCDELEIAGCMDADACNYNAEATDDDGSCTVLEEHGIYGPDDVMAFQIATYSIPQTANATVEWGIENGTIMAGQGTGMVEVVWDDMDNGTLWCQEFIDDCAGPMAELSVSIESMVISVNETAKLSVKLYPNPSNGQLTVDPGMLDGVAQLEVFDAAGRMVHQTGILGTTVLQLNHLANGNYVVKLMTNTAVVTERLVIQH